jgi:hypothetical protein
MKTTKQLRTSEFHDYVAIDIVDESGVIQSTPIYLAKGKPEFLKWLDHEEYKYVNTSVKFDG